MLVALGLCAVAVVAALVLAMRVHGLRASLRELAASYPERQRREAEEREQLLRSLLDASPLAIVLYSDVGRIVFANEPARQLFFEGRSAEGQNFLRLVSSGPEAFSAALLSQSDELASFDIDGQRETYQFVRQTLTHAGEAHTLLLVRHVTREVARQELEVLKRVIRLLSHEVNNALAPVSSLAHSARQILKTGERLERLESVFGTIDERARHLSQFIAGYATLARLPAPNPTELALESLLSRLRHLYPDVRIQAAPDARGYFDPAQLEQALINLIKNAREAGGPPDEVAVEVSGSAGATDIRVLDRGAGFSAEALKSAVLPFFTTKPGGSGVGLALVREVVEAHGGQLRLGAREGGGAAVTLRLPGQRTPSTQAEARARLTLTRS
jgi:two-component system nitrogen regulation sensor histidine kinase NtrY